MQLNDFRASYIDFGVNISWQDWLRRMQEWRGIAHDKGFVPIEAIAHCVHLDEQSKPLMEASENVVPFKRPEG